MPNLFAAIEFTRKRSDWQPGHPPIYKEKHGEKEPWEERELVPEYRGKARWQTNLKIRRALLFILAIIAMTVTGVKSKACTTGLERILLIRLIHNFSPHNRKNILYEKIIPVHSTFYGNNPSVFFTSFTEPADNRKDHAGRKIHGHFTRQDAMVTNR